MCIGVYNSACASTNGQAFPVENTIWGRYMLYVFPVLGTISVTIYSNILMSYYYFQQRIMQLGEDLREVCEVALGETDTLLSMLCDRIDELNEHMGTRHVGNRSEIHMRSLKLLKKFQALKLF